MSLRRLTLGSRRAAGFACGCLGLALALGCSDGGSEQAKGEARPTSGQIVRAVMTSLLTNSVEAREQDAAVPEAVPSEPVAQQGAEFADLEAEAPQTCEIPYNGPVTIVRAPTATAFTRAVGDPRRARMVYETDDTAIWEDGRVVTMDVENLGTHLNAVGWASNPMQILGAGARPGGSGQNVGWDSATSSFQNSKSTQKRKKKRRRRG